jgi:hypothetical protein
VCRVMLPLNAFSPHKAGKLGRHPACKPCRNAKHAATYTPEQRRGWRLKLRYGITLDQYDAILERQGGHCALCAYTPGPGALALSVDHCHATGHVRGLLCSHCNRAIGRLGDSEAAIQRVLAYLSR